MADNPRIDDLRRRVQQDPASIAFAQLAEEHRRIGDFQEAVRVCRAGILQHPGYLSAHVTLGRALVELGEYDEAQAEFEQVLLAAPDNLIALRSAAELHQRRNDAPPPDEAPPPEAPRPEAPQPEAAVGPAESVVPPPEAVVAPPEPEALEPQLMTFDTAVAEFNTAFGVQPDPVLEELEGWLAAILADRQARSGGSKEQDPPYA